MREELRSVRSSFRMEGPIKVRRDLPDVDFLVEDLANSTVAVCELKWARKLYLVHERISRDEELSHGVRQLRMLQSFLECNPNPQLLQKRGFLNKSLSDYGRVEYLLVARDHLKWIPPSANKAVVGFNPFMATLEQANVSTGLDRLLSYEWLPVEGKDFRVEVQNTTVNGVTTFSASSL
jgi:hypothetical protein